jgi:hypothetical protein
VSVEIDGGSEDEGAVIGEREPFSSIGSDDVERLTFSKRRSPLENDSSIV